MKKKLVSCFLVMAMAVSTLAGCGVKNTNSPEASSVPAQEEALEFTGYPINTEQQLTLWTNQIKPSSTISNWKESPFHTGLAEKTGIDIDYTFPTSGTDEKQAFNLMLSNEELPDIIWYSFAADAESLLEDGIIRDLTDLLPKYAPNYWKFLQENPLYYKSMMTDSGKFFGFGFFREDLWQTAYAGPMVRKDWLDECGLPIPETIEDWEITLKAFKDKYDARLVFCNDGIMNPGLAGAFGAYGTSEMRLYIDEDGKVQLAQARDEWKNYISWLHKLNQEGLIDPDIVTIDGAGLKTKVTNDKCGITLYMMSTMDTFIQDAKANGSPAKWVGCPYPVMNKGDKPSAIFYEDPVVNTVAGISTNCPEEKVELALRWLDYPFSEEGFYYWNFGTEGDTYTMENGEAVFTDKITKNELGTGEAIKLYTGTYGWGLGVQALGMVRQKLNPVVVKAGDTWYEGNGDTCNWVYPNSVTMTPDEITESSTIYNAMSTYVKEMAIKFITGEESLDNWDNYINTLNDMGMEKMLEIRQAAYDRYLAR